jgi:thiamine biosynthesis lipoprotein
VSFRAEEFEALGTTARVVVADGSASRAAALLHDELDAVDAAASRFRDDSELMRVNERAGTWVSCSPLLLDLVDAGVRAAVMTNGLVDPALGKVLVELGYDRDFASLPPSADPIRFDVRHVPGWRRIEVDRRSSAIRIPQGVALDLGATGKAVAADRAAHRIANACGTGVLVALGGDIATAGPMPRDGWPIWVADDHRNPLAGVAETVTIRSRGLATSSTTVRQWVRGDEHVHHIVNPATARSAEGPFRTVSVSAATCTDANIAATAALVLGASAPGWLADTAAPARLVRHDGTVMHLGGWAPPADSR